MTDLLKREVKRPGGAWREDRQGGFSATVSEVFPFFFTDAKTLRTKAFLAPAAAVMVMFALLAHYVSQLNTQAPLEPAINFIHVLASSCALAAVYLVYQMCGHRKPWWWLGASALFIALTMQLALEHMSLLRFFERNALCTGLFEELWKSLPVFLALGIGLKLRPPSRERLGVWEPLDGILLAVAAAAGFGLVENLTAYGPEGHVAKALIFVAAHPELQNSKDIYTAAAILGSLMQEIVRSVDLLFGHLAWSGLFGYFIGMAALRPHSAPRLLITGYLTAATLHALWDTSAGFSAQLQIVVGLASYLALASAILKARKISPNRKNNFVSTTQIGLEPPPVVPLTVAPAKVALAKVEPAKVEQTSLGPSLVIAGKEFPIRVGRQLLESDVPCLKPAGADGVVGEFNANPQDARMIGLKNLSSTTWIRTTASGEERIVEPGKSVHLTAGSTIYFGSSIEGKVG